MRFEERPNKVKKESLGLSCKQEYQAAQRPRGGHTVHLRKDKCRDALDGTLWLLCDDPIYSK
jgi:hypothetical protein